MEDLDKKNALKFVVERNVKVTYKEALTILDELYLEHKEFLEKFKEHFPEEHKKYIDMADYFSESRKSIFRARILNAGNNALRNIQEEINILI